VDTERGFTLIEIVITLVVLSIAAVGVLTVFSTGTMGSADPLIANTAAHLAQEKMDSIVGDRASFGYSWITASRYPAENPVAAAPSYNRSVQVICVTNTDLSTSVSCPQQYERVTVTVTPIAGSAAVSLSTVFANYP
jgi:prepilin-type N-terminal cleavage/methylation domain-containing protein